MSEFFTFSNVIQEFFHKNGTAVVFKKGQQLVRADEMSPWIYFVEEGQARAFFMANDASERILGFILPGMVIAQSRFFYFERQGGVECVAHEDVLAYRMQLKDFMPEIQTNDNLLRAMYMRMQENHNFLIERVIYQGEKHTRVRCIMWLECMARYYGVTAGDSCLIDVTLTQDIIANFLALSRESTSKMLNELKSQGLISIKAKKITIPSMDRLSKAVVTTQPVKVRQ